MHNFFWNKEFSDTVFLEFVQKLDQGRVAKEETDSDGYSLINLGINVETKKQWQIGVSNLLNTEYIDYLSRLNPMEIPNQGRNMYLGFNRKL